MWNGLTDQWHPTQMLADVLTMRDHRPEPVEEISTATSATPATTRELAARHRCAARRGRPSRCPGACGRRAEVREHRRPARGDIGARLLVTDELDAAVAGADFLYTDVWLSMGEPEDVGERIKQLLPYQVNAAMLAATGNPNVKFMHCLPALHNRETEVGEMIFEKSARRARGDRDVFESTPRSCSTRPRTACTRSRR